MSSLQPPAIIFHDVHAQDLVFKAWIPLIGLRFLYMSSIKPMIMLHLIAEINIMRPKYKRDEFI